MFLKWFSTREVDAFADSVVADLRTRFPRDGVDVSDRKAAEKALTTIDRILTGITAFGTRHSPNLYQKARFGNRIKWALKDAGYPEPFVEVVTHEFLKRLAMPPAGSVRR